MKITDLLSVLFFTAAMFVAIFVVAHLASSKSHEYAEKCRAANGVPSMVNRVQVCLKPDALVDVK